MLSLKWQTKKLKKKIVEIKEERTNEKNQAIEFVKDAAIVVASIGVWEGVKWLTKFIAKNIK